MNISMWSSALSGMPRITKAEWDRLDLVARWLIATRAAVLIMTFLSSAIGGLLAYRAGLFSHFLFWLCTLGLLLAHATNNLLNDLTDHIKGVDRDNYFRSQYGPQPLTHGLLSVRQLLTYAAVTGALALSIGIYLVVLRGQIVLSLLGVGSLFVLFYTWPLKYIGLGEVAVLLVWGPLMVGGTYYVVTGTWSWEVAIASFPYALGTTAVLFGKHIDKIEADAGKKIRTLPVILGERLARTVALGLLVFQYVAVLYLIVRGYFSFVMLVVLLALPTLRLCSKAFLAPRPENPPAEYPPGIWPLWFVAFAFLHNRRFGLLYVGGLVLELLLRRIHML